MARDLDVVGGISSSQGTPRLGVLGKSSGHNLSTHWSMRMSELEFLIESHGGMTSSSDCLTMSLNTMCEDWLVGVDFGAQGCQSSWAAKGTAPHSMARLAGCRKVARIMQLPFRY